MRRSEAERLAAQSICFNRPFEATQIMAARRQLAPLPDSSKKIDTQKPAEQPKHAEKPAPKMVPSLTFSTSRGRNRSYGSGRRMCW